MSAPNEQHGPLSIVSNTASTASAAFLAVAIAAGGLTLPAAGGAIIGVTQTKASIGKPAKVVCAAGSRTKAISGGVVAAFDKLKVDASGRFVLATAQEIADGKAVAWCFTGASAADRGISVVLYGSAGMPTIAATETIADDSDHIVATSPYTAETLVTLATTNMTGALADGLYVGQKKKIRALSQAGAFTYVLTPTTMAAGQPTSFTFTAAGQTVELTWSATGWVVTGVITAGTATPAAASTINPLVRLNLVTINGAEARTLPSGWVPGHRISIILATATSGSTTIGGLYYGTDGTANKTTITMDAQSDAAHLEWAGARWLALALTSAPIS